MARDLAHLSDEAVVALAARSDDSALAELYDRFGRVVYGLALRMLRDRALAEDAVQDVFLDVWRNAHRFMPERAKASTWILTLAHRRAVDIVRREERRRADALELAPEPVGNATDENAWLRLERERVQSRAEAASGSAARGARARVLRRVHAVGARGEARTTRGYHQEQDVHRPRAPSRVAGRGRGDGMEPLTLHDYTAAYALDALDREESARYEEHLATCERCQEQLAQLSGAAGALAFAVESPAPPPSSARGSSTRRATSGRTSGRCARAGCRVAYTVAAVAAVAAIGLGIWSVDLSRSLDRERARASGSRRPSPARRQRWCA